MFFDAIHHEKTIEAMYEPIKKWYYSNKITIMFYEPNFASEFLKAEITLVFSFWQQLANEKILCNQID